MDFATIKAQLVQTLGRQPSPLAFTAAIDDLNKRLRILQMEATANVTALGGNVALPSDCLEVKEVYIESPRVYLNPTTAETVGGQTLSPYPGRYIVGNGEIRLTAAFDDGFEFHLVYTKTLAALVDDGDTNAALQSAPQAFIYSVLEHHSKLIRDYEAAAGYAMSAEAAITQANRAALRSRYTGGTLHPVPKGAQVI